jgi:adenylosuccinate synthase
VAAHAFIVVDLGFGDAGKGVVTDHLAQRHRARTVVRFNGGAQAGHNVVTADGRHHTFAQLAAASFDPGVHTHLAAPFVLHPTALRVEAQHLARKGLPDPLARVTVSPEALVITPYHQRLNQLRERARGDHRHGTCGVGVGETVAFALRHPTRALRAKHLARGDLGDRLVHLRDALVEEIKALVPQGDVAVVELLDEGLPARWCEAAAPLGGALRDDAEALGAALRDDPAVVFEGAQGVLLDEWHGFHPHTTWSTCTFDNALGLLRAAGHAGEVTRVGVLRTYATRHGEGPLPTERADLAHALPELHNAGDGWQGRFRVGALDLVLARYALAACGGADALAITHLDRVTAPWPLCDAWEADDHPRWVRADGLVRGITPLRTRDLRAQAELGERLGRVRVRTQNVQGDVAGAIAGALEVPLRWAGWGPRRGDLRESRSALYRTR